MSVEERLLQCTGEAASQSHREGATLPGVGHCPEAREKTSAPSWDLVMGSSHLEAEPGTC